MSAPHVIETYRRELCNKMNGHLAYADLEIRILEQQNEGYPVELTLDNGQEFPRGLLDPSVLPWTPDEDAGADGARLFAWFTRDERIRTAWQSIRQSRPYCRLRLRIDATAPDLHALPWERLREHVEGRPDLDLAAADATPFSRYLAGIWQPGSPVLQRPVKVLVVVAAPTNLADYDLSPLDPAAEFAVLTKAAAGLDAQFTPFPPPESASPCTLAGIEAELRKGYHVLHFVGHGRFDAAEGRAYLVLADDAGQAAFIPDADVAAMLARQLSGGTARRDNQLRLVYLDACESAARGDADAFVGLAPALVAAGVPAVLAMQTSIRIDTSQAFRPAFYKALLEHGMADLAANQARAAVLTARFPDYAAPVLFMRLRNGNLLGQRGQVLGEQADSFWSTLLANIADGECTPFLGSGIASALTAGADELATLLGAEFNYPFDGAVDLPRVAQFVGVTDNRRLRRAVQRLQIEAFRRRMGLKSDPHDSKRTLTEVIGAANWAAESSKRFEVELHAMLAELRLPIYITTNADSFMQLALEAKLGKPVRRFTVDWRKPLQPDAARPHFDFDPPATADDPVVVHLFGSDADLLSLVITEDDYLDYLSRIARDYEYLLPTSVHAALASTTLLFLGYRLEDLDLKVILRGLLPKLDLERWGMLHVAVQLEDTPEDPAKQREMVQYLERYFSRSKIDVYWGSTQQFVADLHARWEEYRAG